MPDIEGRNRRECQVCDITIRAIPRDNPALGSHLLQANIMRKLNKSSLKNREKQILMDAMIVTITGISAAMKNTG